MPEKRTFKNPDFVGGYTYGAVVPHWEVHDLNQGGSLSGEMSRAEWDMEVTFTKKAPQFPVGTKVRSKYGTTYAFTVLAQWKDTVIAVDEDDDEIEYFDVDELVFV